jgi:hypothetical protein
LKAAGVARTLENVLRPWQPAVLGVKCSLSADKGSKAGHLRPFPLDPTLSFKSQSLFFNRHFRRVLHLLDRWADKASNLKQKATSRARDPTSIFNTILKTETDSAMSR